MPLYECHTTQGTLNAQQRSALAESITAIHCKETGAPAGYVHVLFTELEAGNSFTAGKRATPAIIRGQIRAGRPQAIRHAIIGQVSDAYIATTGADPHAVIVAVVDVPASWVMEGGQIMPEPGQESVTP